MRRRDAQVSAQEHLQKAHFTWTGDRDAQAES